MNVSMEVALVRGLDVNGSEVWYTGKAGAAFVSSDRADAFRGFTLEGARRKATLFNQMSPLHGLRFIAIPE